MRVISVWLDGVIMRASELGGNILKFFFEVRLTEVLEPTPLSSPLLIVVNIRRRFASDEKKITPLLHERGLTHTRCDHTQFSASPSDQVDARIEHLKDIL